MEGTALFSPDLVYRYQLRRTWGLGPTVAVVGLNPSTADATHDDPTVRRCINFAKREGAGTLIMLNIFAFRATNPRVMAGAADPVGPDNNRHLVACHEEADVTIAAWGVHGLLNYRGVDVRRMLHGMYALGLTRDGHPRHPLYLAASTPLERYS